MRRNNYYHSQQQEPPHSVIEQICVKFLLNLPKSETKEKNRMAYHYQKAFYFYIDQVIKIKLQDTYHRSEEFRLKFFELLNGILREIKGATFLEVSSIIKILNKQKPTCGAIILGERGNKVLVIESGGKLGFPKGGKNQNETSEDCAARETKQEVGLFIHNLIDSSDKVQFLSTGEVPAVYYIIRNFDMREKLTIDKNQIDDAYWMPISQLSKKIWLLTSKSKSAWKLFEESLVIQPKISMQEFLSNYLKQTKVEDISLQMNSNPFLNFKFDRQKLTAALKGE